MATTTTPPRTMRETVGRADDRGRTARIAGALYLLTFVSIPTLTLYRPVREPDFIVSAVSDTGILIGGVLEFTVALACIGTAVALYPVVKRQDERLAMGFVGVRVLEAAIIVAGVACLVTVVTLRQEGVGADGLVTARALVGLYDSAFLLSQSVLPAFNALLLGSLLYRSRLVPRVLPVVGLIGAPLLIVSNAGIMFGLWDRLSGPTAIAVIPIALWEFSLGVYLVVRGFRPAAVADLDRSPAVAGS